MLIHYAEYAQQHGKTRGVILHHINAGHLHTAVRMDGHWMIDNQEPYPDRAAYNTKASHKNQNVNNKVYQQKYRKEHPEKFRAYSRTDYEANREERIDKRKKYNQEHHEEYLKYQKEYYEKHKKSPSE